jgi:hypothetical protein
MTKIILIYIHGGFEFLNILIFIVGEGTLTTREIILIVLLPLEGYVPTICHQEFLSINYIIYFTFRPKTPETIYCWTIILILSLE